MSAHAFNVIALRTMEPHVSNVRQFRLLTLHFCLVQAAGALAGGFVGAYLLKLGFSMSAALLAYAGLLTMRFCLRFLSLGIVRRFGFKAALLLGTVLGAAQFVPLMRAGELPWLLTWLATVSIAESLYWPVYHAAVAVTGVDGARGIELGIRTAAGTLVNVLGPFTGGILLSQFGAGVDFAIAGLFAASAALPILAMTQIRAGSVPDIRASLRGIDGRGTFVFAADGWMTSGLAFVWPMVLFISLGSNYTDFGLVNAGAGLVGAGMGLLCGRALDGHRRDRFTGLVCMALLASFALRIGASWSPLAATRSAGRRRRRGSTSSLRGGSSTTARPGLVVEVRERPVLRDEDQVNPAVVVEVAGGEPRATRATCQGGPAERVASTSRPPSSPRRSWAGIA